MYKEVSLGKPTLGIWDTGSFSEKKRNGVVGYYYRRRINTGYLQETKWVMKKSRKNWKYKR